MRKQKNWGKLLACFWLLTVAAAGTAGAQQVTQTLRGTVLDKTTLEPLAGASVALLPLGSGLGTSADEYGRFELKGVPVGRQAIQVTFTGYRTNVESELLVVSGRESVLEIYLEPAPYELNEVDVTAESQMAEFERIGKVDISTEQFQRIAANYLDPARVVMSSPSVANTNDQNNAISVRGNSPIANTWRLEGVEIVNPNHLANAGTISDRPTQNGGGVNVLSTQMLDNSSFLMGYMPAGYGNALGGIFDMNLRKGNNQQREYTAQASLIGLDFAAEGPFKQGGSASYLVNYRYSFTGVLAAMGVDFGGETIKFQDLSFNVSLPKTPIGKVTLFGVNGWNSNVYRRPETATIDKELSDIDYASSIYAYGITQEASLGGNSALKTVVVFSSTDAIRDEEAILFSSPDVTRRSGDDELASKLSFSTAWAKRWGQTISTEAGVKGTYFSWDISRNRSFDTSNPAFDGLGYRDDFSLSGLLLQPFASVSWKADPLVDVDLGVNSSWFGFTNEFNLEPRLNVNVKVGEKSNLYAGSGLYSQVLSPYAYHTRPAGSGPPVPVFNNALNLAKSWTSELGWKLSLSETSLLSAEVFYQSLYDLPFDYNEAFNPAYYFNYMNYDGEERLNRLSSGGRGQTYGVSVEHRQQIVNGFYIWSGATLYKSEYENHEGQYLPSKFDGRYNLNATVGKEFQKKKSEGSERLFGVNSRLFYQGGFRQQSLLTYGGPFEVQVGDYFRVDLRIQWTRFRARYTRMFAIDIQNALNSQNPAFFYFDDVQGEEVLRTQLGIIPVLVYRIDF